MAHPTDDPNFRLPRAVRPTRYQAHLSLDLGRKVFRGRESIAISLEAAAREVVLHATALQLRSARLSSGGKSQQAKVEAKPASETVLLTFAEEVPRGEAALEIEWEGSFSEGLRGMYLSGKVASTQFEAADARRVFPCFDEPWFKARWAISVEAPEGVAVLGNAKVASDEQRDGARVVRFEETEVLSSYLVALVIGPLAATSEARAEGIPIRTWSVPEKAHLCAFAQEVAQAVLPRLQDYFGLPYAFGKLDQVGIPDFEAGAMENAGLITYREVALLLDPAAAPLSMKKRVAEVITHELSHQWFGNWVTMVWWDDLWLNEAFATWMAYKIVAGWKPEWRVWLDFDSGKASALHLDALKSTHPIRGEVHNAREAGEAFDAITYEKGGAVLRMIEGFLGAEPFRSGIRQYMRQHGRANAAADDLWGALQAASSQPVVEVANQWIRQSGFPLISLSLEGRKLKLEQRRFYSQPGMETAELWPVPVVVRYRDQGGVREHRQLLKGRREEVELPGSGQVEWICGNAGNTGFYRTAYDGPLLGKLGGHLLELAAEEKVALVNDGWALVRAGKMEVGAFLDLALKFAPEKDHAVLEEVVGKLGYVERRLVDGEELARFRAAVVRIFSPALGALGFDPRPGEDDEVRLCRAALASAVGGIGRGEKVLAEARSRLARLFAGQKDAVEPNLLDLVVGLCARAGDAALFDELEGRFPAEPDPATKRRYLMALSAFEDPKLAARGQELFFAGKVPMQDVAGFASGLLANRTGRETFWLQMRTRWSEVLGKTGGAPMLLRRIIESLGNLYERRHLDEVSAHLSAHPVDEAKQATEQTLERLAQDVSLRERVRGDVATWVRGKGVGG